MALNLEAPEIVAYTTKTESKSVVMLINSNPMTCNLVSSSGTSIRQENIKSDGFVSITVYEETKVYWTQNSDSSYNGSSPTTTIELAAAKNYTVTIHYKTSSTASDIYTKTLTFKEGDNISSCLTLANQYCPSGYTVTSVQPSSISNITSDKTINALVRDNRPKLTSPSATLEGTHDGYCVFRVYNSNSVAVTLYEDDTRKGTIGANSNATFNFYGTNDQWNQAYLHFTASGYQNSDGYVINFKPTKTETNIEFNFSVSGVGGVVDKECNLGSVPYSFSSEESINVSYITFTCQKAVRNFVSNWSVSRGTIASVEVSSVIEQQNYVKITFVSPITFSQSIGLTLSITYNDVKNANFSVSGIDNISIKSIVYQKDGGSMSYSIVPFEMEKGSNYKVMGVVFTTTTTETISDIVSVWSSSLGTIHSVGVEKNDNLQQITITFASQPTLNYSTTSFTITYTEPIRTIDFSVSGVGGVVDKKINVLVSSGGPTIHTYPVPIEEVQTDTFFNVFGITFTCQNDEVDNNLTHWSSDRGIINSVVVHHNTVQQNEIEIGFSDYVELSFNNPTLAITFNKPKEKNYTYSLYSNIDDINDIYLKDSTKTLTSSELVVGTNKILKYAGDSVCYLTFSTKENLTYEQIEVYYGNQMPIEEKDLKKTQSGSKYIYEINFNGNFTIYNNLYISINKVDISYTVNLSYRDKDKPAVESQIELDHLPKVKKGTILNPLDYKKDFVGYEFKYCEPSVPTEIVDTDTFYYYYEAKKGKKYKVKFSIENINNVAVSCEYNIILDNTYSISGSVNIETHSISEIEKIISTDYTEDKSMSVMVNAIFNAEGYNSSQQVIENATYTPIE